jgi:integrase
MRKRRNGEGSIYYDESKALWRAMLTTPAGSRLTKAGKDKAAVQDWLNQQRLLVGRGKHIEPHSVTLGEWIAEWLETYAKIKVKPRTYDRYVSIMRHLEPLYGTRLIKLAPQDVQKIYTAMAGSYSAQTILHIKNCLSGCLQQAIENGLIADNAARKTQAPKLTKKQIEIFTPSEIQALLDAAGRHRNALIIPLTYSTGLRLSEVLALRCEDIKGNALTVSQTIHTAAIGTYFSDTKSTASHRTILLPDSMLAEINRHKLQYGIREGLLFRTSKGTPETQKNYLTRTYRKIQQEAGTAKTFHTLRHTHATELIGQGIPIHDVSRRLGHSKTSVTLDIYTHFLPNSDSRMMAALNALLNKKRGLQ